MLGVGRAAVRHVHRKDPDAAARRRDGARLAGAGSPARRPRRPHVVEAGARQDRDAVPCPRRERDRVAAIRERVAEQLGEGVVRELRLLQADDVRLAFVQPRQQPREPLLDRVDVPGGGSARAPRVSSESGLRPFGLRGLPPRREPRSELGGKRIAPPRRLEADAAGAPWSSSWASRRSSAGRSVQTASGDARSRTRIRSSASLTVPVLTLRPARRNTEASAGVSRKCSTDTPAIPWLAAHAARASGA